MSIVDVNMHMVAIRRLVEGIQKSEALDGSTAVVEFEVLAGSNQRMRHGQDRCDANSTCKQQVSLTCEIQLE
ncbi:hypothetical protein D3C80_1697600 [compost metagenome]